MSKTEKMPFMPFYGSDFYESESVGLMEPAEEGAYMRLLWRQWREGSLPEAPADLEKLVRCPVTERVLACFPIRDDNRRRNARLEEIRESHLKVSERLSEAGKRGRAKQLSGSGPGQAQAEPEPGPGPAPARLGESESESESEPEVTTTPPPPRRATDAVVAELPAGNPDASPQDAFRALLSASRNPSAFAAEVRMVQLGERGFRPIPTPEQMGKALWEMHVNGIKPEVRILHAYVRDAMRGPGPPGKPTTKTTPATPTKTIRRVG